MVLSMLLHLPKLDEEVSCEFKDLTESIKLRGCVPFHGRDLPTPIKDRSNESYKMNIELGKKMSTLDGILINSCLEIEYGAIRALEEEGNGKVRFYPIGPLTQDGSINDDPLKFLPSGFLERTKEQGLVVASWAPQVQILRHSSVGGFLSHCGWNSVLESIQEGVPIVAWPLFAEQSMNAVLLTDDLRVAFRLKFKDDEVVQKEEIAKVVKCLMEEKEGKGMRKRIKNLKDAAAKTLKDGSSTQALSHLSNKWEILLGFRNDFLS